MQHMRTLERRLVAGVSLRRLLDQQPGPDRPALPSDI
jgi:hypothetical protein